MASGARYLRHMAGNFARWGTPSRSLSVSLSASRLPSVDRAIVVMRNVRGSAVAWQIPRCGSPAFRSWPRGRQQLALRGRPRLCAARPVEPAGPPSPARLVYGCSAGEQPRVIRIYSAADLGRRRAEVLVRGAHTSGRPSRRTAPRARRPARETRRQDVSSSVPTERPCGDAPRNRC